MNETNSKNGYVVIDLKPSKDGWVDLDQFQKIFAADDKEKQKTDLAVGDFRKA